MNEDVKTTGSIGITIATIVSAFGTPIILIVIVLFLIIIVVISVTGIELEQDENGYVISGELGLLSSKYESNGDPGAISDTPGDIGGKSYGAYQFASNMGSLTSFLGWLKDNDNELYNRLMSARKKDGGYGGYFDKEWQEIADMDSTKFLELQHEYTKYVYYDPVVEYFKTKGFDITIRSRALQNVVWSTAVQHGAGGAKQIIGLQNLNGSDEEIITGIYTERMKVDIYFKSSSQAVKDSVKKRFENELKDALIMLEEDKTSNTSKMTWPVPSCKIITSGFGNRIDPVNGGYKMHKGIDISADYGKNIIAADSGRVITVGFDVNGYGNYIIVEHGNGINTLYGHCSSIVAKNYQNVERGVIIAKIGSTGKSTGNHLHFEVKVNDESVDPLNYVNASLN
ncbi:MAG: M23 family metallopeptidase [Clostridiales bacterium]